MIDPYAQPRPSGIMNRDSSFAGTVAPEFSTMVATPSTG